MVKIEYGKTRRVGYIITAVAFLIVVVTMLIVLYSGGGSNDDFPDDGDSGRDGGSRSSGDSDCGNLGTIVNAQPTSEQEAVLDCWRDNLASCTTSFYESTSGQTNIVSKSGDKCKVSADLGGNVYSCDFEQEFIDSILGDSRYDDSFTFIFSIALTTGKANLDGEEVVFDCA
jgi:hypothetical protein